MKYFIQSSMTIEQKRKVDLRVEKAKKRQLSVLKEMVEGGGKTVSKAGRKQGYSDGYLRSGKLTKTKAWNELLEEQIPDVALVKVHKGLLGHKDWRARDAGLDKGYKIKKRYTNDIKVTSQWEGKSKEEIVEFVLDGLN